MQDSRPGYQPSQAIFTHVTVTKQQRVEAGQPKVVEGLDDRHTSGATRIEASENEAQRLRFWSGRKNAFPASGRISPDYMCMDSTIPRKQTSKWARRRD